MHSKTLIKRLLKIDRIAIENITFEVMNDEDILVIRARPPVRDTLRCPRCGKRGKGYDSYGKYRRWRSLDLGSTRVYIDATSPRITCREHGVIVAKVPWARHDSAYTADFEAAVAWLTLHATAQDVAEFYRIDWHTVGSIAQRVQETLEALKPNQFDGLEAIGIDETSYKKGHKYMTVVIDHKTGHLIWAKKGHGKEVLTSFFEELTEEQRSSIKHVTADGARWVADCVKDFCPSAERCIDPFHVVMWANGQLDEVRKSAVRQAKQDAANGKKAERTAKKKGMSKSKSTAS